MKPSILVLFVVLLAFAVVSVSANHHKKHRANNAKVEEYATTFYPGESYGTDGGDFEWPEPSRVRNFDLPTAFGPGSRSSLTEVLPAKHHGRSSHGSVSH